jgi:SAM-dependent methyltransferase
MEQTDYVIEGGQAGKDRLSLIAQVLQPTTAQLLERAGLRAGMRVLDVGCGGGGVTLELARRVGSAGHVIGLDFDDVILALARQDATDVGLRNVEFRHADATRLDEPPIYDLVYARFLLAHLAESKEALAGMIRATRPGGVIVVEDVDFSGTFCYPPNSAFQRHVDLVGQVIRRHGGDSMIGLRLTDMFRQAGLTNVGVQIVQPVFQEGPGKHIAHISLERTTHALTVAGIASAEEVAAIVAELAAFAKRPDSIMSPPRIFQVWGKREEGTGNGEQVRRDG